MSFSSLYLFLAIYAVMYSPVFKLWNGGIVKPLVIIGLPFIVGRLFKVGKIYFLKLIFIPLSFILVLLLCQMIAFLGGSETTFLSLIINFVTGFMPLALIAVLLQPKGGVICLEEILEKTALVGAVQSVSMLLAGFIPSFHAWTQEVFIHPEDLYNTHRVSGFAGLAGDGLSYSLSLSAMGAMYIFFKRKDMTAWIFSAICWFILASMSFAARTGYVLFGIFLLIFLLSAPSLFFSKRLLILIISFFIFSYVIYSYANDELIDQITNKLMPYAFEFIYNYMEGNGLRSDSSDEVIFNMWIWPSDYHEWLFGSGYFTHPTIQGANNVPSDVGYIRILFYVGILGSILYYAWLLFLAYYLLVKSPTKEVAVFVFAFFMVNIVAQIKFPFLILSQFIFYSFIILFCLQKDIIFNRKIASHFKRLSL